MPDKTLDFVPQAGRPLAESRPEKSGCSTDSGGSKPACSGVNLSPEITSIEHGKGEPSCLLLHGTGSAGKEEKSPNITGYDEDKTTMEKRLLKCFEKRKVIARTPPGKEGGRQAVHHSSFNIGKREAKGEAEMMLLEEFENKDPIARTPIKRMDKLPTKSNEATPTLSGQAQAGVSEEKSPVSAHLEKTRQEEAEALKKCKELVEKIKAVTCRQRNISDEVKTGLVQLEEILDVMGYLRKSRLEAEKNLEIRALKTEREQKLTEATKKRALTSPAEQAPEKRRKNPDPENKAEEWKEALTKKERRRRKAVKDKEQGDTPQTRQKVDKSRPTPYRQSSRT